jgi:hypothetical protein
VVATLSPGAYTVQVIDRGGNGGFVLAEVYDLGPADLDSQLTNASSLTTVPAGGDAITGFILAGTASRDFLVRGVGPGLTKFGVNGVMTDPRLTMFDTAGNTLASVNNWSGNPSLSGATVAVVTAQGAVMKYEEDAIRVRIASAETGAFPLEQFSYDAAMVVSLAPGAYTVQLTGMTGPVLAPTVVVTPTNASLITAQSAAAVVAQSAANAATTVIGSTSGVVTTAPTTSDVAQAAANAAVSAAAAIATTTGAPGVVLFEIYALPR